MLAKEIEAVMAALEAEGLVRRAFGISPVEDEEPPEHLQEYVVRPGDWFSKISLMQYGDMLRYPEIFEANKDGGPNEVPGSTDPDRIEPGWKLVIP